MDDAAAEQARTEQQQREDAAWRAVFLLKEQMTLEEMESRCLAHRYRFLEEFRVDAVPAIGSRSRAEGPPARSEIMKRSRE